MRICVVGGGHIGTTLACFLKHANPGFDVRLLTRGPERFSRRLRCNDIEQGVVYDVSLDAITSDAVTAVAEVEVVFICLPHFAVEQTFARIGPYVASGAYVGVIPGSGGGELCFDRYFGTRARMFGFQRVPFTAKLVSYGRETNLKSWKPFSVVGALHHADLVGVCEAVEACGLKTARAENYLAVSLAPSNPILHTSRTFGLFRDYRPDHLFDERLKYYVGWTDDDSRAMLGMDAELHALLDEMPELDMSSVKPLAEHYEAASIEAMTNKINSIPTFQSVYAPLIESAENPGKYVADRGSRMFTEDFPWGLAIIKGYCEIFDTSCPVIDGTLAWYADYMGLEYFRGGAYSGKGLALTGIPQNHGIETKDQVIEFYSH